jgi:CBS domain-containing protein
MARGHAGRTFDAADRTAKEQLMATHATPRWNERPAAILAQTRVRAAMPLGLFECAPDDDVRSLARTMAERTIHAVVVPGVADARGQRGRLAWGIVSDIDLMRGLRPGLEGTTAGELAATHLVFVLPPDTLEHAAQLMAKHDIAHLVVVSPDTGRPVGMVSTLDIARVAAGL